MDIKHWISEGFYAYKGLFFDKKTPVIVYSPGRTGSISLINNLREADQYSFKVESFRKEKRGGTLFVRNHVLNKKKAKIITPIRDPLAMMCSYFFSKGTRGWIKGAEEALLAEDISQLQRIFIQDVLETERLNSHLYWFENEFEPTLGINVFDYPFDTQNMSSVISHPNYPTLILRTELDDTKKEQVINLFLGTTDIKVTRENTRTKKGKNDLYNRFKNNLEIPRELLEKIYSSPYSLHFFSPTERAQLIAKWSANNLND